MSQPSIAVGWLCECLQGRRPRAVDWMALLASANGNWLTPAICVALAKSEQLDHLPHDVTAFLRHIHDHNVQRNTRLLAQLHELLAAFNRAGIEPTLTKGAAHLFTSSRETFGARMMSDLDVFIETTEIAAAEQCLIDLGRQRIAGLGWGRPTDVGLIDLHYPPGSLPKYFPIATALSTHSNRESRQGVRAKIPSPTWRAAHLVVHDQIKDGDWWLGGLDVRHLYQLAELTRSPEGIDWRALTSAMPDQLARDALESSAHRTSRDVRYRDPRVSTLGPVFTTMAACSPHLSGAPPGHQCTLAGRRLSDLALSARSCRTDTPRRCCRAHSRALQEARSGAGANAARRGRAGAGPEGLIRHGASEITTNCKYILTT